MCTTRALEALVVSQNYSKVEGHVAGKFHQVFPQCEKLIKGEGFCFVS